MGSLELVCRFGVAQSVKVQPDKRRLVIMISIVKD